MRAHKCKKEPRFQVSVGKEINICRDALVKKAPKKRNMSSQSGMELELGYFKKACLDLIQVFRLCHPNSAVGGDHKYIFVMAEV